MANTPLFHELHSVLFHSLVGVINEIHAGEKLTRKDVLRRLQPFDPVDTSRHEELIETMFSFSPNGEAELFLEKPVRLPPTRAELRWLKTMLEDESAAFLVARRRSVTLRLAPKNNAVERAFCLFAPYDKEAAFDEESGVYTLTVFYYDFDEQEMIGQILSLGSAARVLAPEKMRQEIIAVLRDECSHFF